VTAKLTLMLTGVLLAGGVPAFAHHSFSAEYDSSRPRTFSGTVTRVEWTNPHARFYIDVEENGTVTNWEFEIGAPAILMRRGWTKNSMKTGDKVVVDSYLAKDGANLGNARTIKLVDGRKLFAGSTTDGGPTQ
jgi:uncharacterized protein DUF6152